MLDPTDDFTPIEEEFVAQVREMANEQHLRDTEFFLDSLREMERAR